MHACRYTRDCWLFPCMVVVELHTLRWKSHVRFDVRRTVQPILRNGRSKRGTPASGNDLSPVFVRFCATGGVNYFHRRAALFAVSALDSHGCICMVAFFTPQKHPLIYCICVRAFLPTDWEIQHTRYQEIIYPPRGCLPPYNFLTPLGGFDLGVCVPLCHYRGVMTYGGYDRGVRSPNRV